MQEFRRQRGREYFDKFWTLGPAQEGRDLLLKYQPDLCSLFISLDLDSAFRILQPTFLSKALAELLLTIPCSRSHLPGVPL
jgi:hypothetical protein